MANSSNKHYIWPLITLSVLLIIYYFVSGFYVKVVDQDGNAVPGVKVLYGTARINRYFGGAGRESTTNFWGYARLKNQSTRLASAHKEGFEFNITEQLYLSGRKSFDEYKIYSPMVIKGWRYVDQPEILVISGVIGNVVLGQTCEVLFSGDTFFQEIGPSVTLNIKLIPENIPRADSSAGHDIKSGSYKVAILTLSEGRIKNTHDLFMNKADSVGYKSSAKARYGSFNRLRFFIEGKSGKYFGGAMIRVHPIQPNRRAKVDLALWANPDGTRNIQRPRRLNLYSLGGQPKEKFECSGDE